DRNFKGEARGWHTLVNGWDAESTWIAENSFSLNWVDCELSRKIKGTSERRAISAGQGMDPLERNIEPIPTELWFFAQQEWCSGGFIPREAWQ
ncbi:MAG TPA: hypothetical protein VMW38_15580, partial [Terriglobia bacterium]|nr:hypothetical protein [Terriglobia bacterium]